MSQPNGSPPPSPMPQRPATLSPDGDAPTGLRPHSPVLPLTQRAWFINGIPLATSLAIHVGILLAVLAAYEVAKTVLPVLREQTIIPDAAMVENAPVGGAPNPGALNDPNRPAAQSEVQDASTDPAQSSGERVNQAVMGGSTGDANAESVIGIGGATSFNRGKGSGPGSGGDGNARGMFGVPGGGAGKGPKVSVIGGSSNARRIVLLCDASGSMLTSFPALQSQLRKTIDGLIPAQSFNIIFFSEDTRPLSKAGLLVANSDNKRKAYDFLAGERAVGPTNPFDAIKVAFSQQPELVFVLTDGFDQGDPQAIKAAFTKANVGKKTRINTIYLKSSDDPELVKTLKEIASESGGLFREINKNDL